MIDKKTNDLMLSAKFKKQCKKRKQEELYRQGKKQGGKYTHDINRQGNTVSGSTIRKLMEKLDDKKQREKYIKKSKIKKLKFS